MLSLLSSSSSSSSSSPPPPLSVIIIIVVVVVVVVVIIIIIFNIIITTTIVLYEAHSKNSPSQWPSTAARRTIAKACRQYLSKDLQKLAKAMRNDWRKCGVLWSFACVCSAIDKLACRLTCKFCECKPLGDLLK